MPKLIHEKKLGMNAQAVFRLARMGCTMAEVAQYFMCSITYISQHYREDFRAGRAIMKMSIRRMQLKRAREGSDQMLIHLGRVYCGQSERIEVSAVRSTPFVFETGDDGRDPELQLIEANRSLPAPEEAPEGP